MNGFKDTMKTININLVPSLGATENLVLGVLQNAQRIMTAEEIAEALVGIIHVKSVRRATKKLETFGHIQKHGGRRNCAYGVKQ